METASAAIEVRFLSKVYTKGNRSVQALHNVSFKVNRGEIFGLLGPNGAGKTTSLKILTTLISPTSGSASVLGYDISAQALDVRRSICVVVQENAIELFLSVRNNFKTFGRFHGLEAKEIESRTARISELFGLTEYLDAKGIDLSGGLKRRVQVAKMFLVDKPIVFLDEATTGMDTFNKRTTIQAIKEESRKGRTIVLTTHMLDEAEELCDSLVILNHGSVIAHGSIEKVKSMGLRLLYLNLKFKKLTQKTVAKFAKGSLKTERQDTSLEVTVRDEKEALKILSDARKAGGLEHFEITTASLEDVFVELIDKKGRAA